MAYLILTLSLGLAAIHPAHARPPADTADPLATLQTWVTEINTLLIQLHNTNDELALLLRRAATRLDTPSVSVAELERAYLDLTETRTQRAIVASRLAVREEEVRQLERQIVQAEAEVQSLYGNSGGPPGSSPARRAWEARLRRLLSLREATAELVARGRAYEAAVQRSVYLNEERLTLLQGWFRLSAFPEVGGDEPRLLLLQRDADGLLRRSMQLRIQAQNLRGASVPERERRYLLQLQAWDAQERSNIRQTERELLRLTQSVARFEALIGTEAMPLRVLGEARRALGGILTDLELRREDMARSQEAVAIQRQILDRRELLDGDALVEGLALLDGMDDAQADQETAIGNLAAQLRALDERLGLTLRQREFTELLRRRYLPYSVNAWHRAGLALGTLPARLLDRGVAVAQGLRAAYRRLERGRRWSVVVLPVGAWLGLVVMGGLLQRLRASRPTALLDGLAHALLASLWAWLPALCWLGWSWILAPGEEVLRTGLVILLVWPLLALLLGLGDYWLRTWQLAPDSLPARQFRRLRWVLIPGGVVLALLLVARDLGLPPGAADAVDRLSLAALLLVALLDLRLRFWLGWCYPQIAPTDRRLRWLDRGMVALMGLLVAVALMGLVGYVTLAWTVMDHLLALALSWAAGLLALGILRDQLARKRRRLLAEDPERAAFWTENFLAPGYRLGVLAVTGLVALALWHWFDWSATTPGIRELRTLGTWPLFSLGGKTFHLADLALTVVSLGLILWFGGWVRRVSFRTTFGAIRDHGVRQSLSVFGQYLVVLLGVLVVIQVLGVDLTALAVFAGALGVGIGLGLQSMTNNFISGLLLLAERPLRVGDAIRVGNHEGEVMRIGIRSLTLKTWDNQEVILPNSAVVNDAFVNWTRSDDLNRILFMIPIGHDDDPERAVALIGEVLENYLPAVRQPPPKILLWEFTDSAMLIRVQYHVHYFGPTGLLDARAEVLRRILRRFQEAGIRLPRSQHDVHWYPDGAATAPSPTRQVEPAGSLAVPTVEPPPGVPLFDD